MQVYCNNAVRWSAFNILGVWGREQCRSLYFHRLRTCEVCYCGKLVLCVPWQRVLGLSIGFEARGKDQHFCCQCFCWSPCTLQSHVMWNFIATSMTTG